VPGRERRGSRTGLLERERLLDLDSRVANGSLRAGADSFTEVGVPPH
jgi:hypothetical protein